MARPKGAKSSTIHIWTNEQKEYLQEIVIGKTYAQILELVNKKYSIELTLPQIRSAIHRYKLKTGTNVKFEKCNKRRRLPIGSERVEDGYIHIKVGNPSIWKRKHVHTWEKYNGEVPNGYIVIFLDQNKLNTDISNLAMISRRESVIMSRNRLYSKNKDITIAGINIAKLIARIGGK